VVTIETALLVSLIAGITAATFTVILVFLVVIYNNTKETIKKEDDDDGIFTVPYSSFGDGGGGNRTTLTLGDLLRMQQAAQAAKEKETPKADVGGGQYL